MIPLSLRLRNFMSYQNPEALDFRSFHLACLCGENGHGKSTLLDAITWALWGRSRAKTEDELICAGTSDMEVEYEFQLGENEYRVLRKRMKRTGPSRAVLELQVRDGDAFRPMSGNGTTETQKRITDLLKLDYETFVNSSFLLQGKADLFTQKTPALRKRLLADILGLSVYDALERMAKDRANDSKQRIILAEQDLERLKAELDKRPLFEAEAASAEQDVNMHVAALKNKYEAENLLRARKSDAERDATRAEEISRSLESELSRQNRARAVLARLQEKLNGFEAILAERGHVLEGYERLQAAAAIVKEQGEKAAKLTTYQNTRHDLEQRILLARQKLERTQSDLLGRIATHTENGGKIEEIEGLMAREAGEQQALASRRTALEAKRAKLQGISEAIGEKNARQELLKREMNEIKKIMDDLKSAGQCFVCGQKLSPADFERVLADHESNGVQRGREFRALRDEIVGLKNDASALTIEIQQETAQLDSDQSLRDNALGVLRQRLAAATNSHFQAEKLQEQLAETQTKLSGNCYAQTEQEKLRRLEHDLATIAFDNGALESARSRVEQFQRFEEQYRRLCSAQEQIDDVRAGLADTAANVEASAKQIALAERELGLLKGAKDLAQRLGHELSDLLDDIRNMNQLQQEANRRHARAQQQLEALNGIRTEYERTVTVRDEAATAKGIYDELAASFGKNGVQAMIIDSAIPEIENAANEILIRMTDGRMQVRLLSQRPNQTGDIVETLDIQISDEGGMRNYEMFSGGEAFRIDFALRIALAKLLARRAGARLETLVIDEGFGTQDAAGRDRLVEALQSIEDEFAKIVIVTHIEELKDAFPVRINVTKGVAGSEFSISRR